MLEKTLNQLARESMKLKLLADIRIDLEICKLEGYDCKEYLKEIKELIDSFFKKEVKNGNKKYIN